MFNTERILVCKCGCDFGHLLWISERARRHECCNYSTIGSAVTVGNFDGMHAGHQRLIQILGAEADKLDLPNIAVIFEPQPQQYFAKGKGFDRLSTLTEKYLAFKKFGIDAILVIPFIHKFATINERVFVEHMLIDQLKMRFLVVGEDFRFGYNKVGGVKLLKEYADQGKFMLEVVPKVMWEGRRVSSSWIRKLVRQSDWRLIEHLLGHPYSIFSRVVRGDGRARELGVPTANLNITSDKLLPVNGVYVVRVNVLISSKTYYGIANLGVRPTFKGSGRRLEVHIFDFDKTLYGQKLNVEFLTRLRSEKRFKNVKLLYKQLREDVKEAKKYLETTS